MALWCRGMGQAPAFIPGSIWRPSLYHAMGLVCRLLFLGSARCPRSIPREMWPWSHWGLQGATEQVSVNNSVNASGGSCISAAREAGTVVSDRIICSKEQGPDVQVPAGAAERGGKHCPITELPLRKYQILPSPAASLDSKLQQESSLGPKLP